MNNNHNLLDILDETADLLDQLKGNCRELQQVEIAEAIRKLSELKQHLKEPLKPEGGSEHLQVGGNHYKKGLQPIDLMKVMEPSGSVFLDFCRGSIIKYAFRKKGDERKMAEDLRKTSHYATMAADEMDKIAEVM